MSETLLALLGVIVTAAVGENVVFSRAFGAGELDYEEYTPARAVAHGVSVTALTLLAALCGWMGEYLIDNYFPMQNHLRPPVFLGLYSLVFVLLLLVLQAVRRQQKKETRKKRYKLHTAIAFGYLPMGTMLVVGFATYSLWEALCYGLGSGIGYTLAMLLCYCIRERLEYCDLPKAFRGAPALLLYFGLLSLALFGLVGHQLAF